MMIEISESKVEKMSDYAEKMLKYGGKLMQCIEELSGGESMGRRERYYDDDDDRYDETRRTWYRTLFPLSLMFN